MAEDLRTEDPMDARLRAAGERWRAAAVTDAAPPDGSSFDLHTTPRPGGPHRRTWITAVSAAVVAAAVVLGATAVLRHDPTGPTGATATGAEARTLTGTSWQLVGTPAATLHLAAGRIRGSDGCNSFDAPVRIDGRSFTATDLVTTAMACAGMRPEVTQVLAGRVTWSITAGRLTVVRPGVGMLVYRAAAPASRLRGTSWTLAGGADARGTRLGGGVATLRFDDAGAISAYDGCNTVSGPVTVSPTTIEPGRLSSTEIACLDPGFAPVTRLIDSLLARSVHWTIRDGGLVLTRPGTGTLTYRRSTPFTTTDPTALVGRPWTLTGTGTATAGSDSGSASTSPVMGSTQVTFGGVDGSLTIAHRCYVVNERVAISSGSLRTSVASGPHAHSCPHSSDSVEEGRVNDLVDRLLNGLVSWSIEDGQLTLTRDGVYATFTRP